MFFMYNCVVYMYIYVVNSLKLSRYGYWQIFLKEIDLGSELLRPLPTPPPSSGHSFFLIFILTSEYFE